MNITSRQLKAFLLTAKHQSFSRAAEQLYISQSGMSVLIRELEEQLGFRLFERTTRRVTLTEFGSQFLPVADRSLGELEEAAASIARSASEANRRLVIGATPLIAGKLLPAVIGEYAKRNPALDIILQDGDRAQLVAGVASGEIDLALGCFLHPVPGMRRTPLYRFRLMVVQQQAEAARLARDLRWEDLLERRLLGAPRDNPIQQVIEQQLERIGRSAPPQNRFNYFETQIAMAEVGVGVAILPTFCIPACRDAKVSIHPLTDPEVPIDLFQISDRGRKLPPAADEFTAFLALHVAEWAEPWSAPALGQAA